MRDPDSTGDATNPKTFKDVKLPAKEETEIAHVVQASDERMNRRTAEHIMAGLTPEYRRRIVALVKAGGQNHRTRRATSALVRLGLRDGERQKAKARRRLEAKAARDVEMEKRIAKRLARGVDRPLPGMSWERYLDLKNGVP